MFVCFCVCVYVFLDPVLISKEMHARFDDASILCTRFLPCLLKLHLSTLKTHSSAMDEKSNYLSTAQISRAQKSVTHE